MWLIGHRVFAGQDKERRRYSDILSDACRISAPYIRVAPLSIAQNDSAQYAFPACQDEGHR